MEPRKNVGRLLEAFLLAAELAPGLTLDLVSGDAWGHVLGQDIWVRLREHPRLHIHQRISDESMLALYRQADYLVYPSLYEGFGLPILEAVGHCAVVANDIPVFREIAGLVDGMRLMDLEADAAAIAAQFAMLDNAGKPAPVDDHGVFSWESSVARILAAMNLIPASPRLA